MVSELHQSFQREITLDSKMNIEEKRTIRRRIISDMPVGSAT